MYDFRLLKAQSSLQAGQVTVAYAMLYNPKSLIIGESLVCFTIYRSLSILLWQLDCIDCFMGRLRRARYRFGPFWLSSDAQLARDVDRLSREGIHWVFLRKVFVLCPMAFLSRLSFFLAGGATPSAVSPEDVEYYGRQYSKPGAMRCGFNCYRAFHLDGIDNAEWRKQNGKLKMPTTVMCGEQCPLNEAAENMGSELCETWEKVLLPGSGHWMAVRTSCRFKGLSWIAQEENPEGFIDIVSKHLLKHL
jgi:pimeloyl-ACP methyl ester carboxylesterase